MTNNKPLHCQMTGIGACGPGFSCWRELVPYLNSNKTFCETFNPPKPQVIPANERRRAPLPVKLAIETSQQALEMAGIASKGVACVFGSGLGDMQITDYLCRALNSEQKQLSPTKFHNSVHNAAAGYWTISSQCMQPANSIAAGHYTFSIALLEAMCQCVADQVPVLMTLFDIPVPTPMTNLLQNAHPCSVSVLLQPTSDRANQQPLAASIEARSLQQSSEWPALKHNALHSVYRDNPAAKSLLLLEKLIHRDIAPQALPLALGSSLELTLKSC